MSSAPPTPVTEAPPAGVDKSGGRVRTMFGEIAGRYDLLNHVLSLGVDVYWRWRTVRTVSPTGESPILDVCTGTGDLAFAYQKRSEDGVRIIGSDFTRPMLTIAQQKQPRRQMSSDDLRVVHFVEADAQALPFADDQFQIVSVAFGLRNVADTRRGLREMIRVSKRGGNVAVLEFSQPTSRLFGGLYRFYFKHVLPRIGQLISGSRMDAYNYLPESVGEFPCGAELARVMEECGLENVRFRPLTFGIATLYWGAKPMPASAGPLR